MTQCQITITQGDPRDPQTRRLLEESQALMRSLFPPEDNAYLDVDALCGADIEFFVARTGDAVIGTAALALKDGYGELKSMFVDTPYRGSKAADLLVARVIEAAMAHHYDVLRLETGNLLKAAHRFYRRNGFELRGPFGAYQPNQTSLFMERKLG